MTLTAAAVPGSNFAGWSGGGCSGTGATCTVTMSADTAVTATFTTTLLLNESFETGSLPTGWARIITAGSAYWWFNYAFYNTTGGSGGCALGATYGAGPFDAELRSSILNLATYNSVGLEFKTSIEDSNSTADVDVSVNGSTGPWVNVWHKVGWFSGPQTVNVDLSTATAGHNNVVIRFHHTGSGLWWVIDDVKVMAGLLPVATTTSLLSGTNPSSYGQAVTFTASVAPGSATGTVTFKDGSATLGTGTLTGGSATYSTTTLAVGSHGITATYGGDGGDSGSVSSILTQTVNGVFTITTTAGANGSISPSQVVNSGSNSTAVTITPNSGYHIASVLIDSVGQSVSDSKSFSYTFIGVTANHAVSATFAIDPLTITTASSLVGGTVGFRYSRSFNATGGAAPYSWSTISGNLPTGLSLNSATGYLAGMPTSAGSYTFTVAVTDSQGTPVTVTKDFTLAITVAPPTIITLSPLAGATVGFRYSKSFNATGGVTPFSWTLDTGNLPPGLTLNAGTGYLAGMPTTAGTYSFTIKLTDGQGTPAVATKGFSFTVAVEPPAIITLSPLTSATVGVAYSKTLSATGGVKPYTWSVAAGTLPPGITLDGVAGKLTGTATAAGTYNLTLQVSDSQGTIASKSFPLTVN